LAYLIVRLSEFAKGAVHSANFYSQKRQVSLSVGILNWWMTQQQLHTLKIKELD
jgi:hypothetical protein